MKLKDFLANPIGKGDASVNVNMIKSVLDIKYQNYSKKDKITIKVYRQSRKDIYWYWLTIPSETQRDNSYDVVFRFTNPDPKNRFAMGIGNFNVTMFANSPSFAYTYAYVYKQNELLINELGNKFGKGFLTKAPSMRNRQGVLLFDKYIYFGARHLMESKILNRGISDVKCKEFDKAILSKIRTLSTIMDEYRVAEDKVKGQKKRDKLPDKKKDLDMGTVNRIKGSKKTINNVKKITGSHSKVKKKGTIKKK